MVPVHIGKGEQFSPDFSKISPNNKIPALIDHDGPDGKLIALFESGAIMMYLAEKTGWRFMPTDPRRRYEVLSGSCSRWAASAHARAGPPFPPLRQGEKSLRYRALTSEATRLYRVLDTRLGQAEYLAGEYRSPIWRSIRGCVRKVAGAGHRCLAKPAALVRGHAGAAGGAARPAGVSERLERNKENRLAKAGTCCSAAANSTRSERACSYDHDRRCP